MWPLLIKDHWMYKLVVCVSEQYPHFLHTYQSRECQWQCLVVFLKLMMSTVLFPIAALYGGVWFTSFSCCKFTTSFAKAGYWYVYLLILWIMHACWQLCVSLCKGSYSSLCAAFESLPVSSVLEETLSNLSTKYPLITLLYINFTVVTNGINSPSVRMS